MRPTAAAPAASTPYEAPDQLDPARLRHPLPGVDGLLGETGGPPVEACRPLVAQA